MIERHPNLRWEFFTWGAKNVAYQRHVIMGFGSEDPKFHTNIDIDRNVATYGHRVVAKRGSVPTSGTTTVCGAQIDVDAVAGSPHSIAIVRSRPTCSGVAAERGQPGVTLASPIRPSCTAALSSITRLADLA